MPGTHNKVRDFTVPQVQALRTLYGCTVNLCRNAQPVVGDYSPSADRHVKGGDFLALIEAIDKVNKSMKE